MQRQQDKVKRTREGAPATTTTTTTTTNTRPRPIFLPPTSPTTTTTTTTTTDLTSSPPRSTSPEAISPLFMRTGRPSFHPESRVPAEQFDYKPIQPNMSLPKGSEWKRKPIRPNAIIDQEDGIPIDENVNDNSEKGRSEKKGNLNTGTTQSRSISANPKDQISFKVKDTRKTPINTNAPSYFSKKNPHRPHTKRQKLDSSYSQPPVVVDDSDEEITSLVDDEHGEKERRGDEIDRMIDGWAEDERNEKHNRRNPNPVIDLSDDDYAQMLSDEEYAKMLHDQLNSEGTPPRTRAKPPVHNLTAPSQEELDEQLARQLQYDTQDEDVLAHGRQQYPLRNRRFGALEDDIANLRQMGGNYRAGGGGGGGWMHHSHESGLPFGLASIGAIAGLWQRRTAPRGNARSRANTDPLMLSLGMMDRDFNENDYDMLLRLDDTVKNKGAKKAEIVALPKKRVAVCPIDKQPV